MIVNQQLQAETQLPKTVYGWILRYFAESPQGKEIASGDLTDFDLETFRGYLNNAPVGTLTLRPNCRTLLELAKSEKAAQTEDGSRRLCDAIIHACTKMLSKAPLPDNAVH